MITEFLDSINPDLLNWILLSIPLSILIYTAIVEMIKYRQYLKQFNPITEMKLELKHLAPYLPYGLKVVHNLSPTVHILIGIHYEQFKQGIYCLQLKGKVMLTPMSAMKPILRPLSDLHKRIQDKENSTIPANFLYREFDVTDMVFNGNIIDPKHGYEVYEYLISYHFDVFNLIPAGLAIDANTLNL